MARVPFVHLDVSLATVAPGAAVGLGADDEHHLRRVLRLRDGAEVVVSDGDGHLVAGRLVPGAVELAGAVERVAPGRPRLTLVQALPKGRKLDEVVRQATELGVARIVPVAAARSVAVPRDERAGRAVERWRAVARAAAEQARQPWLPTVTAIATTVDLATALDGASVLVADPGGTTALPVAVPADVADLDEIAVAVGPEGGWSPAELTAFTGTGARTVAMGATVLRTEHAGAAALAVLAATTGRWEPAPPSR